MNVRGYILLSIIFLTTIASALAVDNRPTNGLFWRFEMYNNSSSNDYVLNSTNYNSSSPFLYQQTISSGEPNNASYDPNLEALTFNGLGGGFTMGYQATQPQIVDGNTSFSAYCWVNMSNGNVANDSYSIIDWRFNFGAAKGFYFNIDSNSTRRLQFYNGGTAITATAMTLPLGNLSMVSFVYNTTHVCFRTNNATGNCVAGVYNGDDAVTNPVHFGHEDGTYPSFIRAWNGTIQQCGMYLRNLSQSDIQSIYDFGTPHSTGGSITITANFSNQTGTLGPLAWCVNTHGSWGRTNVNVQTDTSSCTQGFPSDSVQHREWLGNATTGQRWDMSTNSRSTIFNNPSLENWKTNGSTYITNYSVNTTGSASNTIVYNWDLQCLTNCNGTFARANDTHYGLYSLNMTKRLNLTGSTASVFASQTLTAAGLTQNHLYTLTGWVKANNTTTTKIHLQETTGFTDPCTSNSVTGNDSWQFLNCTANLTTTFAGYRIVLEITSSTGNALFDDIRFLDNNNPWYYQSTSEANRQEMLNWTCAHGGTVELIASYGIAGASNYTDVLNECPSNSDKCHPENASLAAFYYAEHIKNLTNDMASNLNCVAISTWNEPDISFWMPGISYSDPTATYNGMNICDYRALAFYPFNNAMYSEFKSRWPNNNVIMAGFAGVGDTGSCRNRFMQDVVGNRTTGFDNIGYHDYYLHNTIQSEYENHTQAIHAVCSNCTPYLTESNIGEPSIQNDTTQTGLYATSIFAGMSLQEKQYPNSTFCFYQWTESFFYNSTAGAACYPQYPDYWEMVSESHLQNKTLPPFNVYENLTHLFPVGTKIYSATDSYPFVYSIVGKTPTNDYVVAVANMKSYVSNISVDTGSLGAVGAKNWNGTTFTAVGGRVDFGYQSGYSIIFANLTMPSLVDCGNTYAGSRVYSGILGRVFFAANESCNATYTTPTSWKACTVNGVCATS
jgi:hypothetical protein